MEKQIYVDITILNIYYHIRPRRLQILLYPHQVVRLHRIAMAFRFKNQRELLFHSYVIAVIYRIYMGNISDSQ